MNNQHNLGKVPYSFSLLRDEAVSVDSLEGKSHEQVANQIYDIICQNEQGLTIGIEGPWGTGKTTVINILESKLDARTLFVNFDAWAHEGDPLRIIFLENLLNRLRTKHNIHLKKLSNKILKSKRKIKTINNQRPSLFSAFLAFSVLLTPFGSVLLSNIDFKLITVDYTGNINYLAILGTILMTAPALCVVTFSIINFFKRNKSKYAFLQGNTTQTHTQKVTSNNERSSIDFEKYFSEIMSQAFDTENNFRNAIIVVDNLDRLDPESATSLWATLQTFFQHDKNICTEEIKKTWFILPYDKDATKKLLSNNLGSDRSESFLEKTIQLSIDVPKPIYSSWTQYLNEIAREALTGTKWNQKAIQEVCSAFQRYHSNSPTSPTPRYMRRYINQVGANALRWGSIVSLESIALFSMAKLKDSTKDILTDLLTAKLPEDYTPLTPKTLVLQELAGMLYGVKPEIGFQHLLKESVRKAVYAGNKQEVTNLMECHHSYFLAACLGEIKGAIPMETHTPDYKIRLTSGLTPILLRFQSQLTNEINALTDVWKKSLPDWKFEDQDCVQALTDIETINPNWCTSEDLNRLALTEGIKRLVENLKTSIDHTTPFKHLHALKTYILTKQESIDTLLLNDLDKELIRKWNELHIKTKYALEHCIPKDNIIKNEIDNLNPLQPDEKSFNEAASLMKLFPRSPEWNTLQEKLCNWLSSNNQSVLNDQVYKLTTYYLISFQNEFSLKLEKLIKGGTFNRNFNPINFRKNPHLAISIALLFKDQVGSECITTTLDFWTTKQDRFELDLVFGIIKELNIVYLLWNVAEDEKNITAIQIIRDNFNDIDIIKNGKSAIAAYDFPWLKIEEKAALQERTS
ncbi:P-loop NTPase fold protein [Saccharophagus degradans]|uniref:P-loop NTPase fold protein n=1 Tax=Saccharophagus degradans TaxID=86304 RepID=A0AAW7X6S4_9GAMM|nr:P-loop NTPase fold protein [Saccharophagus degradans]MDO6423144.1 P-loop NTPase fold protein [Saccharophagus degradans]MDO6607332.1 P-loop NTPase fold protein [Saccharophagus degradans]